MNRRAGWDLHSCFVLHSRPYSDTSLLVEFFSQRAGRIPAIARGARARNSRVRGVLQPFVRLLAGFGGRGEVSTLTGVEARDDGIRLSGRALYCGFYLNELLMRLLQRGDPHEDLFTYYQEALKELSAAVDVEPCLRRFEMRLLAGLGYGLCLDTEAESGEAVRPERSYRYEIEKGAVLQGTGVRSAADIRGKTLLALAHGHELAGDEQTEARRLMRRILSHYLGHRPLKSRELFRSVGSVQDERDK